MAGKKAATGAPPRFGRPGMVLPVTVEDMTSNRLSMLARILEVGTLEVFSTHEMLENPGPRKLVQGDAMAAGSGE